MILILLPCWIMLNVCMHLQTRAAVNILTRSGMLFHFTSKYITRTHNNVYFSGIWCKIGIHSTSLLNSDIIYPDQYYVIGASSDINLNGGVIVDYVWSNFDLSNFFDEVIIEHPSGFILDYLEYDYGQSFISEQGYSIELIDPAWPKFHASLSEFPSSSCRSSEYISH